MYNYECNISDNDLYDPKHVAATMFLIDKCCVWCVFIGFFVHVIHRDGSHNAYLILPFMYNKPTNAHL